MSRPHLAGLAEDGWNTLLGSVLRARGWRPLIVPHVGYGGPAFLRVLARVVLAPEPDPGRPRGEERLAAQLARRGWRNFVTAEAMGAEVSVTVAVPGTGRSRSRTVQHHSRADRSGNVDLRIPNPGLTPGWHHVTVQSSRSEPVALPVLVVDEGARFGIVSDLDDTVIRTYLPRPLIAAYNAFVVSEGSRKPVPGMAELFDAALVAHEGAPVFYLSTGAWNTAPMLGRFLARNGFPRGPLLLTDWGPTNSGWFRSGAEHKRATLRSLAADFPDVSWLLVGDDGQRDPAVYAAFAAAFPDRVRAIALRQLPADEQVLAHGTVSGREDGAHRVPEVRAPDGHGLLAGLRDLL